MTTALSLWLLLPAVLAMKTRIEEEDIDSPVGLRQVELLHWGQARAKATKTLQDLFPAEKAVLLHGAMSYMPGWYVGNTLPIPGRLPALTMQDAGNGFRTVGPMSSGSVVQWPCALALAATWDEGLVETVAAAMGKEFKGKGANVMLGPGLNVHRVAQGGRNWEYLSGEDPYLGARLARHFVRGVQSQGVMAVAKHFAFNEQETNRGSDRTRPASNAVMEARTAWELYYPPFQAAVDEGIGAIMCSYNKVNGRYACENENLLKRDLKGLMGFQGFVMSDWGATHSTSVASGLDQDMPGGTDPWFSVQELYESHGSAADDAALRVLSAIYRLRLDEDSTCVPPQCVVAMATNQRTPSHQRLARQAVAQSVILLKNEGLLPLSGHSIKKLAVLGTAALGKRSEDIAGTAADYYSGGGSGHVQSKRVVSVLDGIRERGAQDGMQVYYPSAHNPQAWIEAANWSDAVLVVGATTAGENRDRPHLRLDDVVEQIVGAVHSIRPTAVVMTTPGAVLTPWRNDVNAVAMAFLPGEETGHGIASVLFGDESPQGRLPLQMPATPEDVIHPGRETDVVYSEGLFTSYRSKTFKAAFPFGHGLSYTSFAYSTPSPVGLGCRGAACVSMTITNTGKRAGTDTPQAYIHFDPATGEPDMVLRGFKKTQLLEPGESETVKFVFTQRDISVFDSTNTSWVVQKKVHACLGSSSTNIRHCISLRENPSLPPEEELQLSKTKTSAESKSGRKEADKHPTPAAPAASAPKKPGFVWPSFWTR